MRDKLLTCFLVAAVFMALGSTALASTTWYVNGVSGSDGNDCKSPTTACKTIGHAISLAASGDSIMVGAATYPENLSIGISLTIMGSGAGITIVDGGGVNRVLAISSSAQVSLSRLTVRHGYARSGGGISNNGVLTINHSVISANTASSGACNSSLCENYGGGIQNGGTLTLNNSSVKGNKISIQCTIKCFSFGGGIWNSGTLVMNSTTVSGNSVSANCPIGKVCDGEGGGIFNHYATVTISKSTISGNGAKAGGGIENTGTLTMTNSTVNGNTATSLRGPASAGGIVNFNGGTLLINNSTISGNRAQGIGSYGGGIYAGDGTATLQNSIVADNTLGYNGSGANCYGTVTSNGYNLSSDGSCNFTNAGDLNNTDPMLGPLQNNGGPTKTMALPTGSPAIDAGNPNGCNDSTGHLLKTDQRGKPRPDTEDTGGCDRGAYERQSD